MDNKKFLDLVKSVWEYPTQNLSFTSDVAIGYATIPQHSGITGSHGFPNEITVENFTLGLHVCSYCHQQIYIGEQIKNIVALSCPSCGAPLEK